MLVLIIAVSGKCCSHINIPEAQQFFKELIQKELSEHLLPSDRSDNNFDFGLANDVELPRRENFLVVVRGDLVATHRNAEAIAMCSNAAFYCYCRSAKVATKCIILDSEGKMVAASTKKLMRRKAIRKTKHPDS